MNDQNWLDKIRAKVEEEHKNYKGPHYCLTMDTELKNKGTILHYSLRFREYGVKIPKSTGCMLMDYCMFCGKKLPLSVRSEWHNILETEYGLESPDEEDKKVPKEFWSDEWWKKRGL
jgi:hypothetical protein